MDEYSIVEKSMSEVFKNGSGMSNRFKMVKRKGGIEIGAEDVH